MFPSCIVDIHVHFDFESIVILHILHVNHFLLVEIFLSYFIYKLFSFDDRDDALNLVMNNSRGANSWHHKVQGLGQVNRNFKCLL